MVYLKWGDDEKMKTFNKMLGQRIRTLRDSFNLSQEDVSKKLGISRVSLSQIENGDRKLTAEEITKVSKMFNIATDVLLDLKKEIEVKLEKKETVAREKTEMRISIPQKNLNKFKEVLLYVLNKVGSKPNTGETVLYKLLYFIDFNFYEKYEEQLIGATYQKNHYGPTPVEFKKVIKDMKENEDLEEVQSQYFQYPQRKYLPRRSPDLGVLSAHEIKMIDEVLEKLSDMNAQQISDYSHEDIPWKTTEDGDIIDYESVFYRTKHYSVRMYDDNKENIQ